MPFMELLPMAAATFFGYGSCRLLALSLLFPAKKAQRNAVMAVAVVFLGLLLMLPVLSLVSFTALREEGLQALSATAVVDGSGPFNARATSDGFSAAVTPSLASSADVLLSVQKRLSDAREAKAESGIMPIQQPHVVPAAVAVMSESESCGNMSHVEREQELSNIDVSYRPLRSPAVLVDARDSLSVEPEAEAEAEQINIEEEQLQLTPNVSSLLTLVLERSEMVTETVGDTVYHRSAYWGTLHVGNPAKPFKVVFDTGSGHLILPSTYCRSETCKAHRRYSRMGSTSGKDINTDGQIMRPGEARDQLSVSFGTGEVEGVFVEDTVCFRVDGGLSPPSDSSSAPDDAASSELAAAGDVECMEMRFVAATELSEDPFKDFVFDGVLGLGLSGLSQTEAFNFLHVMAGIPRLAQGGHSQTFAVFLAEHAQEDSAITLGGWEEQRLQEELRWSPVVDPELGHWTIKIKSLRVDGELVEFCREGCKAVVDTGTSLVSVPTEVFPEVYEMLRHPAPLEGLCGSGGPQLQIELEDLTITLGPEDYAHPMEKKSVNLQANWGQNSQDLGTVSGTRQDMWCKPMLMAMDLPEPIGPKLFILGEPVLRKYYTVYDAEQKRVGFGLARHSPKAAPTEASSESEGSDDWWDEAEEEIRAAEGSEEAGSESGDIGK